MLGLLKKEKIILNDKMNEIYEKNIISLQNFYNKIKEIIFCDINLMDNKKYLNSKINHYDVFNIMTKKYLFNYTYESIKDYIFEKYNIEISKSILRYKQYMFTIDYFKKINDELLDYLYRSIIKKKTGRLLSCDGTTAKVDISLKKYNYNAVPTDSYCEFYISTLFDSENNVPLFFSIDKQLNERESFKKLKSKINDEDIVVFDRGYPSDDFMKYLNDNNIKYIIRAKCDHFAVIEIEKLNITDKTYAIDDPLYRGFDFRIIKYIIQSPTEKDIKYFVLTNLFDVDAEKFNDLYFKRWRIEVYYDKFKNYVNGGEYFVKSEEELFKAISIKYYGLLLTQIIIIYIKNLFGNCKDNYVIDFNSALRITHNLIINDMIYDVNNYQVFFAYLLKIKNTIVQSLPNRSFLHYPTKKNIREALKFILKEKNSKIFLNVNNNDNCEIKLNIKNKSENDHEINVNNNKDITLNINVE